MANLREKKKKGKRGLSDEFMKDLKDGILSPILEAVKKNNNLILEIRDNEISIYYRGGILLNIEQDKNCYFINEDTILGYMKGTSKFDDVSIQQKLFSHLPKRYSIIAKKDAKSWADSFYIIMSIMDNKLAKMNKLEREFQQIVVCENNMLKTSNDTDYYIIDSEYRYKKMRPDLIALRWDSTTSEKINPKNCRIAIIEMKYGYGSINNDSGLLDHVDDMKDFLSNKQKVAEFKNEMLCIFRQKIELGLIHTNDKNITNKIKKINVDDKKIEYILLLANYKQKSNELKNAIGKISEIENAELKFAEASFMGYGLYSNSMLTLEQFKKKIHAL